MEADLERPGRGPEYGLARAQQPPAEERRYRDLVEGLDSIIWEGEVGTGRFTFVSRRAEEMLGYPVARWLEEPGFWAECIHPDDRAYALANRRRCVVEGFDIECEYRVITAKGRVAWLREVIRLVRDDRGRPHELRGSMWNITRRKKIERQLHAAKRELTEQLADVSYLHEVSLQLSPTLELKPLLDEILSAAIAMLGAECGAVLVADQGGGAASVSASIGLGDKAIELLTSPPREIPDHLWRVRKTTVIPDLAMDLFREALRSALGSDEVRALTLTPLIARCGDHLGTIVIFFPEPHQPPRRQIRLLEIYARQAADFVEAAQLRQALREAGRAPDAVATPTPATPATPRAARPRRLLIVDARPASARALRRLLESWGHEVHTALDAPSALEAAREHRPEVVLIDGGLPGRIAAQLACRLGELHEGAVQVALLTGYQPGFDHHDPEPGIDRYLIKPIEPEDLRALLEP